MFLLDGGILLGAYLGVRVIEKYRKNTLKLKKLKRQTIQTNKLASIKSSKNIFTICCRNEVEENRLIYLTT